MKRIVAYQVTDADDGLRLERILRGALGLSSREISQAKFRERGICVNGIRRKVTEAVHAGDQVEVCLEEEGTSSDQLEATPGSLRVLYEDADVLAVDKPAGLVCHPSGGHYRDTLANIMQYYFREKGEHAVIRLVGRLDQETSGIVLAAKSQAAACRLNRQRDQGILKKEYLALVQGCPRPLSGVITEPIGPVCSAADKAENLRAEICMQITPEGKRACTHYEVLESRGGASLVRLWLETGRTHQIRVHMASLGHPLLGDTLYGTGEREACFPERAALHAVRLEFCQPFTKERICLEAPLPADLCGYLRERGFTYDSVCGGFAAGHCADCIHI